MTEILLCAYNGAEYIEAQLMSILHQTVQDFHILVSDDGSTDGTPAVVERIRQAYPDKITLIVQDEPSGGACRHFLKLLVDGSWRAGAQSPDYVMFSDQDDVWHPDKLEKSLGRMRVLEAVYQAQTPLLVHCDSRVVDAALHELAPSYTAYQGMSQNRRKFRQLLMQNNVTGGAMMINRALAALVSKMPVHAVMHDQWIALLAAAFGEIRYIDEALYDYRQHTDNVLGARRGSRVREVLNRLGIGRSDGKCKAEVDAESQSVYHNLFLQAESFMELYGARLPKKERRVLAAFIGMQKKGRIGKICDIVRWGFTYNKLHRTLGACLFL